MVGKGPDSEPRSKELPKNRNAPGYRQRPGNKQIRGKQYPQIFPTEPSEGRRNTSWTTRCHASPRVRIASSSPIKTVDRDSVAVGYDKSLPPQQTPCQNDACPRHMIKVSKYGPWLDLIGKLLKRQPIVIWSLELRRCVQTL